jgi:ABC-type antimicrobial peptide transport system permease subunit
LAAAIASRFPDLVPHTRAAFQRANQREIDSGFLPLVALVGILGLAASAVLVVLLVHGAVEEDRENIAILFALGAQTGAVRRGVLRHGLLMIGTGALAGTLAALALRATFDAVLPTIPLLVLPGDVAAAVGAFILAGGAAALVPVARLRRVDPLDAFRP